MKFELQLEKGENLEENLKRGESCLARQERDFASKVEELAPTEELLFEPTPSFGWYKPFFDEHAVTHPAKANTRLLEFLVLNLTRPGETVLDPMAGTGSTGVVAALHGRDAVQVELERKFYGWMEEARRRVESHSTLTPKGRIMNILGDARCLSKLLDAVQVDATITSPPYAETYLGGGDAERRRERLIRAGHNPGDFLGGKARNAVLKHYGEVDTIITSPPYEKTLARENPNRKKGYWKGSGGYQSGHGTESYGDNPENIGNLPHGEISAIITSQNNLEALERGLTRGGKPTYLSEMLKVYREMWKVLRPNGLAAIIVKPFVRDKKVVDLPYHTWLLMQKVGFTLERVYRLRLKQDSFWRILYHRKHPEVPQIQHEWVIVARK